MFRTEEQQLICFVPLCHFHRQRHLPCLKNNRKKGMNGPPVLATCLCTVLSCTHEKISNTPSMSSNLIFIRHTDPKNVQSVTILEHFHGQQRKSCHSANARHVNLAGSKASPEDKDDIPVAARCPLPPPLLHSTLLLAPSGRSQTPIPNA